MLASQDNGDPLDVLYWDELNPYGPTGHRWARQARHAAVDARVARGATAARVARSTAHWQLLPEALPWPASARYSAAPLATAALAQMPNQQLYPRPRNSHVLLPPSIHPPIPTHNTHPTPPYPTPPRYLAELVISLIQRTAALLSAEPPEEDDGRGCPPLPPLPPPMLPGNYERATPGCLLRVRTAGALDGAT